MVLLTFILLMVTLFMYSMGNTLGARHKIPTPIWVDMVVLVILWSVLLFVPVIRSAWYFVVIWFAAVVVLGFLMGSSRYANAEATPPDTAFIKEFGPLRQLWERWKLFAIEIGHFQGLMLMGIFYFTILLPFGLGVSIFGDRLAIKSQPAATGWVAGRESDRTLEDGRRQY